MSFKGFKQFVMDSQLVENNVVSFRSVKSLFHNGELGWLVF